MKQIAEIVRIEGAYPMRTYLTGVVETLPHSHNEIEFCYVLEGDMRFTSDRQSGTAHDGDILVFNPYVVHSFRPVGRVSWCYFVQLRGVIMDFLFPNVRHQQIIGYWPVDCDSTAQRNLYSYLHAMMRDNEKTDEFSHAKRAAIAVLLLSQAYEVSASEKLGENRSSMNANAGRISQITAYILQNYAQPISIHTLAEELHLNASYLSHYTKDKLGQTFVEYLTSVRILNAKLLLRRHDRHITQIAEDCGFGDVVNFGRVFRKQVGCSPREYQKQLHASEMSVSERGYYVADVTGIYSDFAPGTYNKKIEHVIKRQQDLHSIPKINISIYNEILLQCT